MAARWRMKYRRNEENNERSNGEMSAQKMAGAKAQLSVANEREEKMRRKRERES